ncbi:MAG TPA: TetR/AcrR family transcriptional regulator [Chloroflexia bacterium]|jgi:AcrR family transcriptional regulator|nr:TetR/AcrR family transcriptional regulator [Chloroflexia bacterium]
MGRRQGPSEERRAAILQAAEAVFTEAGYTGASIREIARRAEVSSALLYWFFPNKAKLFAAMLLAKIDAQGVLELPPEIFEIPPEELLPRLAHGFARFMGSNQQINLMKLMLRESDREPELIATMSQTISQRALTPLGAYMRRQMDLGRIRRDNPEFVAQAFLGMFIAVVLRREILQEPESRAWDLDNYVDTAVAVFLRGAVPAPGEVLEAAPAPPGPAPPMDRAARKVERIPLEE